MAKVCTFETYDKNGEPLFCCEEVSTEQISVDVVDVANQHWQDLLSNEKMELLWVIYTDLCYTHVNVAKNVYNNLNTPKEVKDELHIQVGKT